ncbi:MAG: FecR domain-containing protein [Candidatus Thiodiazotropha sp. (ex Cardiolucina cf. quadrata)]|nr:FecR domain-containing protein [Candidatus Thiodiazotropha sp. (ex Cardiolucina cf. quadrata)]
MTRIITSLLFFVLVVITGQAWSEDWAYRIHEGENLSIVAERFLKSEFTPEQLQIYNGIANNTEIPIGTEIRVPIDWLKEVLAGVKVKSVFGDASLQRTGANVTIVLVAGTMLNAGDRITTGVGSSVSLHFADNSTLLIGEESEVVFDALSSFHGMGMLDTRIRLQRGRIENRIKPLRKPEYRYEIHTPAAVTMVRGTEFRVFSDAGDEQTRSEVTEGKVSITAEGETVLVEQGEGTLIEKGKPPSPPRALLVQPDLTELTHQFTMDGVVIEWSPLVGATAYRYQLTNREEGMVAGGISSGNRIELPRLLAGDYRIALRGIDELGFEGFNAYRNFTLEAVVTLPVRVEPEGLTTPTLFRPQFSRHGIHIHWTQVAGAWAYRLILARDVELEDKLFTRLSEDNAFILQPLPPGHYFIGVEALSAINDDRSRSDIYRIGIPVW